VSDLSKTPVDLSKMAEATLDELCDVLCDATYKRLGTKANLKARQLARQLHDQATRLRNLLDPS